jgi:hypothetical protein
MKEVRKNRERGWKETNKEEIIISFKFRCHLCSQNVSMEVGSDRSVSCAVVLETGVKGEGLCTGRERESCVV